VSESAPETVEAEELDPDPEVIVCQGPPVCHLTNEQAIAAQQAGCRWCKRIILHYDGSETVIEPSQC